MQSIKRVGGSWSDHTTRELGALLGSVVGRKKGHAQPQAGWGSEYGPDTLRTRMHCKAPTFNMPAPTASPAFARVPLQGQPNCAHPSAQSCSHM